MDQVEEAPQPPVEEAPSKAETIRILTSQLNDKIAERQKLVHRENVCKFKRDCFRMMIKVTAVVGLDEYEYLADKIAEKKERSS